MNSQPDDPGPDWLTEEEKAVVKKMAKDRLNAEYMMKRWSGRLAFWGAFVGGLYMFRDQIIHILSLIGPRQ